MFEVEISVGGDEYTANSSRSTFKNLNLNTVFYFFFVLVSPAAAIAYGLEKVGDNKARDVLITDLYNGAFSVIFLGVDGGIDFVWRFGQPDLNCEVDQKVLPFVRRSCCRRLDLARPVGDERQ